MPAKKVDEAKLRRVADGTRSISEIAARCGISRPTAARWIRKLNLPTLPPGSRIDRRGDKYCRVCGTRLETGTDGLGRVLIRCMGCERRKARRCMDCNRAVPGPKVWRCSPCKDRQRRSYAQRHHARNREEINRRAKTRHRRWSPERRAHHLAVKKAWRERNWKKAYEYRRRARLNGKPGGWSTREKYLAYQKRYREAHREELARKARERIADERAIKGPPRCVECGAEVPWNGKHRPAKRCPQHHRGVRRPQSFDEVAA